MGTNRIIPCLDMKNGRVVKGVSFVHLRDAGDPISCAIEYDQSGADEIVLLDITATQEKRETILLDIIRQIANQISIPITVGGGIRSLEDVEKILAAGASKVSVSSAGIQNPELIEAIAKTYGSQCLVCAIDAKREENMFEIYQGGGQIPTGLDATRWAKQVETLGAGEILLTSMDKDGQKTGYDIEMTRAVAESVNIPVIASGGAGKMEDFYLALTQGKADSALAASLFHFGEVKIPELKDYLQEKGISVKK